MKGVTFRISATVMTVLLVFMLTGKVALAFQLGTVEFVAKIFLYYSHERMWNIIGWGRGSRSSSVLRK
jgi:uncharacterized membrane protein